MSDLITKLHRWYKLSGVMAEIKPEEMELRKEICQEVITEPMKNGRITQKDVIDSCKVTAVQTLGYKLDIEMLGSIWEVMTEEEKDTVKMVPTLQVGPYKKLPEDSILHEAVTSYLAAPTLKVEPPIK